MKKPQAFIGLLAALGTAIGVLVAVLGLPYGRADYSAFAEVYHGATNTTGTWHQAVDTQAAAGTQPSVTYFTGPASFFDVTVVLHNESGASAQIGAWGFDAANTDGNLEARAADGVDLPLCDASGLACNPDFDAVPNTGGWSCAPPAPDNDIGDVFADGSQTTIGCFNGSLNGQIQADGTMNNLAAIHYRKPAAAVPGTYPITLANGSAYDVGFGELMSCNPVISVAGDCFAGEVVLEDPPTNTVTNTPEPNTFTPTNTPIPPTNTPTNTNTPTETNTPLTDSGVVKDCSSDVGVQDACNLWICEPDLDAGNDPDCDGEGEGSLRVVERALNVPATTPGGLGAYEFSVEYDNFVIQSVNPCDIVFGPTGLGTARGPVDEIGTAPTSDDVNADCGPDPDSIANGTCAYSIVLENIIHFGCVTANDPPGNSNPGPIGSFDLASLVLIPHPDLNNDLFPGNNNGVLTVLKDNGCELVDAFGHAIPGSINGGLTILCRDLAVTVRILEGDLDLDCDVDLTDAQEIAGHYGAFFGGLLYSKWLDLEPQFHDLDIDIKDIQKVFGRQGSTCQNPIPDQDPLPPFTPFGD